MLNRYLDNHFRILRVGWGLEVNLELESWTRTDLRRI